MAYVKKFKKYEFEDIRTDYLPLDATHKANTQAPETIPSRTLVSFASADDTNSPKKYLRNEIIVSPTDIEDDTKNKSVFMLAEDYKPGDNGIVYFVIEHIENLEDEE